MGNGVTSTSAWIRVEVVEGINFVMEIMPPTHYFSLSQRLRVLKPDAHGALDLGPDNREVDATGVGFVAAKNRGWGGLETLKFSNPQKIKPNHEGRSRDKLRL